LEGDALFALDALTKKVTLCCAAACSAAINEQDDEVDTFLAIALFRSPSTHWSTCGVSKIAWCE